MTGARGRATWGLVAACALSTAMWCPECQQPVPGSIGRRPYTKQFSDSSQKTIYGDDDRMEESEVEDGSMLRVGAATAAIVRRTALRAEGSGSTRVFRNNHPAGTLSRGRTGGLCSQPPQRFGDQPALGMCSGTLIAPDLFATAGHCLASEDSVGSCVPGAACSSFGFIVFDFTSTSSDAFPAQNVYTCRNVVHCVVDSSYCYGNSGITADWAVIRLDRAVTGRTPVTVFDGLASVNTDVYIVGHPTGLPRKYTDGGTILAVKRGPRDNTDHANVNNLITNLDSFQGNSGSGVFHASTHQLIGILVTGGEDWEVTSSGCTVAHTCIANPLSGRYPGCPGEEAVASTVLLPILAGETDCLNNADCNHGTCVLFGERQGMCTCNPGYHGPDCSFQCDRAYCNNRGECTGYDVCECDNGASWPTLCSVPKEECTSHSTCQAGAYCALLDSGQRVCWECTDCESYTCEQWGDSIDGDCSICHGASAVVPPPPPRGNIRCNTRIAGNTEGAVSQIGSVSGEHLYQFTLRNTTAVHIDSCNSSFDTHLRIMSEDLRTEVGECDDCGANND